MADATVWIAKSSCLALCLNHLLVDPFSYAWFKFLGDLLRMYYCWRTRQQLECQCKRSRILDRAAARAAAAAAASNRRVANALKGGVVAAAERLGTTETEDTKLQRGLRQ